MGQQLLEYNQWSAMDTSQSEGKYLGIYLGPTTTPEDTLQEMNNKFIKRMKH